MPEVSDHACFSVGEWRNQMPAFQQFLTAMEPLRPIDMEILVIQ
jgi:hypothetical protein